MYVPIALALYTLTNKSTPSPTLGTLLMVSIAVGCMIGGPMSPTGGARNALMIGFLGNMGVDISFMGWLSMGFMYTLVMSVVMAFLLPFLFKPEVDDLSEDDEDIGDDFESLYKGEISKSGAPILPSKRARKVPEKIQVSKEDLAELQNSDAPAQSENVSSEPQENETGEVSLDEIAENDSQTEENSETSEQ